MFTQGTENFNLPLYQGTDKPAWTDTNEGYAAIDEAVGSAVSTVEGLDTRVATVEAEISDPTTGLDAQLATVKEDVSTLSGDVGALSGTVSGLQSEIDDVRADCEDMITSNHESTATSSKRYEVGQYFIYNDVLYKCTVQINQGDTIVPNTNCEATNVMTEMPSGGGGTVAAADVTYNDSVTQLSANNVQAAIVALKTLIDNIPQGGGEMPNLKYGTPLHTFDSVTTFTASKACYLLGCVKTPNPTIGTTTVAINGTVILDNSYEAFNTAYTTSNNSAIPAPLKVNAGDVITVSQAAPNLHVFEEVS